MVWSMVPLERYEMLAYPGSSRFGEWGVVAFLLMQDKKRCVGGWNNGKSIGPIARPSLSVKTNASKSGVGYGCIRQVIS
jgi:hypothetical protein